MSYVSMSFSVRANRTGKYGPVCLDGVISKKLTFVRKRFQKFDELFLLCYTCPNLQIIEGPVMQEKGKIYVHFKLFIQSITRGNARHIVHYSRRQRVHVGTVWRQTNGDSCKLRRYYDGRDL